MAEVLVQDSSLQDIADAIREKNGTETTYLPSEMGDAVREISGGGGGIPAEALIITGNCSYRFANDGWNWFIEEYGDQITTEELNNATYMFSNSTGIEEIPFDLNLQQGTSKIDCGYMFQQCGVKELRNKIRGNIGILRNMFSSASDLRFIAEDFFSDNDNQLSTVASETRPSIFNWCSSLRTIPNRIINNLFNVNNSNTSHYLYNFNNLYSLDKIQNLRVDFNPNIATNNYFSRSFSNLSRCSEITFDNTVTFPETLSRQTIDLSENVGFAAMNSNITAYNSGITADKEITDDATYQALKNDPDWFTCDPAYSRYNHDSAVNTINSLPDFSFGTGNTIKFNGEAGSKTDGGAINTLTPEEIAVASAKGWTVTFV